MMTSEKRSDWRGSSNRFPEGKYLVDPMRELIKQSWKFCEESSESGSVECRFLSSALLRWRTYIPNLVVGIFEESRKSTDFLKTGVALGQMIGVKITAGCQECGRHKKLSTTLSIEFMAALLSKNLVLSPPEGTFISWRLEIGNTFQGGQWEMSR